MDLYIRYIRDEQYVFVERHWRANDDDLLVFELTNDSQILKPVVSFKEDFPQIVLKNNDMEWSHDHKLMIFSASNTDENIFNIYYLPLKTGELTQLTHFNYVNADYMTEYVISPNGKWVAYLESFYLKDRSLYIVPVNGDSVPREIDDIQLSTTDWASLWWYETTYIP